MSLKVAVVEDDQDLAEEVQFHLRQAGMTTLHAQDAATLDRILAGESIDVIVLDLGLPGEDGLSIARRLSSLPNIRIVMLTARTSVLDRIQGFDSGADVYLTKPVNMQELVRVVFSVARRLPPRADKLKIDAKRGLLHNGARVIELTSLELEFMLSLAKSEDFRVAKVDIEHALYPQGDSTAHRKLEVMLSRLRSKLKEFDLGDLVRTDWGRGFILTREVQVE